MRPPACHKGRARDKRIAPGYNPGVADEIDVRERAALAAPPEAVWAFLADTDRLNRAVGLPPVRFAPWPDPSRRGHYRAEARFLGRTLRYEEFPFDWVEGRRYSVRRRFEGGPLEEIQGGILLAPGREGGTDLEVFALARPRSRWPAWLVRLALRKSVRDVLDFVRAWERHRRDPSGQPDPSLPPPRLLFEETLEARLRALGDGPLAGRLGEHLRTASDLEVTSIRPYELADRWGFDRGETLRFLLRAVPAGLLELVWSVLCPHCHAPGQRAGALEQLRRQVHCDTCGIDFGTDLAASVEARFAVHPAVRRARAETYCIGGPANTPAIVAQWRLEPGERRREEVPLRPGTVRIRCYPMMGFVSRRLAGSGGGRLRIECGPEGLRVEGETPRAGEVLLEVQNSLNSEALLVLERESWREAAATGLEVLALQDFRELFPGQAPAPGERLAVSSLAVLFTDLRGSTELYRRVGDGRAFAFVREHFRYLAECVSRHRGGLVKTMGDAVMACFSRGRDALEAAVEMQQNWDAFLRGRDVGAAVRLKVGVHQGPSIAIRNGDALDYFGTTVNLAARVQGQSAGGDVVFTRSMEEDPEVRAWLAGLEFPREEFSVALKGLEGHHALCRLRLPTRA
jgi:class 3 adenylate cyclase